MIVASGLNPAAFNPQSCAKSTKNIFCHEKASFVINFFVFFINFFFSFSFFLLIKDAKVPLPLSKSYQLFAFNPFQQKILTSQEFIFHFKLLFSFLFFLLESIDKNKFLIALLFYPKIKMVMIGVVRKLQDALITPTFIVIWFCFQSTKVSPG